jgi:hypothetical protein
MNVFQRQLEREEGWDVRVAAIGLALFFLFGLIFPRSWFWFWFAPMAAFWFRYLWVRCRRDEALLGAIAADIESSGGAAGCYRSEAGICITDGTEHVLVLRDQRDALLQLQHVRRRQ